RAVTPVAGTEEPVKYKKRRSGGVLINGTTEQYMETMGFTVAEGRFLSAAECNYGRPVCVIGALVATNLFQNESPIGNRVTIGQSPFEVVGVLEKQGGLMESGNPDNQVMIPLPQFMGRFWDEPDFEIQVKVKHIDEMDDAKEELHAAMRRI